MGRYGKEDSIDNIYSLNGKVPVGKALPFGLQHVLAMFVANIAPILIVAGVCGLSEQDTASLVQTAMMIAGLGSLIQIFGVWKIGARLPIVMGISFTFVSILCYIGPLYGYSSVVGAVIIGGIIEGLLGFFVKYWRKIMAPIVSACVVTAIGFSLLSVGAESFAGGRGNEGFGSWQNWVLGTFSLVVCIVFQTVAKKHWKQLSVLVGLLCGYVLALCIGVVDFSLLQDVEFVAFPNILPFKPTFQLDAIISVVMIFLVSATETIGDTTVIVSTALHRDATNEELAGSLTCDGFMSSISALFGCLPITSFSQNVGLIAMTKVINRFTIALGAMIMVIAGLFPVFGAILATLPEAVLGGCTVMMFGSIVISGLQMLSNCGYSSRNIMIMALSLSIGIGFTQIPEMFEIFPELVCTIFGENCVAVVFVVSIVLNLVLSKEKKADDISD